MLAYGIRLHGIARDNELTGRRTRPWPSVELARITGPAPIRTDLTWGESETRLEVASYATLSLTRTPMTATVTSPRPISDDEVVHPLLTIIGSTAARWQGRSVFHGAAVVLGGAAWILLAAPHGGKSSLTSELHERGHPVLSDDLTVIERDVVFAGPRTCDLREGAASHLDRGDLVRAQQGRVRFREVLRPAPCEAPLGGFVSLTWGDRLVARRADVATKLRILADSEALARGPSHPRAFLELLGLPMVELTRPRTWDSLSDAAALIEHEATG